MEEMQLAPGHLDSHIKCGASRLRRRLLDVRTSRQGRRSSGRHRGAGLVRRGSSPDRQVPRCSPCLQELRQHRHPYRRDGRFHEGRNDLCRRSMPQRLELRNSRRFARFTKPKFQKLRTEEKRTSIRVISYVLLALDEAALRHTSQAG